MMSEGAKPTELFEDAEKKRRKLLKKKQPLDRNAKKNADFLNREYPPQILKKII